MGLFPPEVSLRAFDAVCGMKQAINLAELDPAVHEALSSLGFPCFGFAKFFSEAREWRPKLFTGRIGEWGRHYVDSGYGSRSAIARNMLSMRTPYSWGDMIAAERIDDATRRILDEARDYGLTDGLYLPVALADGSYAAVVLAGSGVDLEDPLLRAMAEVVASYYASEGCRMIGTQRPSPALSPRQRECLSWARLGKSSVDIAEILGLSVPTVDGHFAEACRKLGVRTRIQAVVEACQRRLIEG